MGDRNQVRFIDRWETRLEGPFLEVGSKDYGSTEDLRSRFASSGEYVGVDAEEGPGVDRVVDLTLPFEEIEAALGPGRYGTIFCLSVLEHCEQPFRMAENLTALLAPGGKIVLSVPFAWKYHGYPDDYWRFTHRGLIRLFSDLDFDEEEGRWATPQAGDLRPLDPSIGLVRFGASRYWREGRYLRGVVAAGLKGLARIGPLRWLCGFAYVMPPTSVYLVGVKPGG